MICRHCFSFTGLRGRSEAWIERPPNWRFPPRESTADPDGSANKADPALPSTIDIHPLGW
jgi:hypothetical protein